MLISSKNTFTATSRLVFDQIPGPHVRPVDTHDSQWLVAADGAGLEKTHEVCGVHLGRMCSTFTTGRLGAL